MTTAAFRALLGEAQAAHARHRALADFGAFPGDLAEQARAPLHVAAAEPMAADAALRVAADPLAGTFAAAGPDATWRETCKNTAIGADFMARFGCYCPIGPGAPWTSRAMHAFVVYMPPGLCHPWHHHPAEELYLVLAGEATFRCEGRRPQTLRAGDSSFHGSMQPHATETRDAPLLACVVWRKHLDVAPALIPREVAA